MAIEMPTRPTPDQGSEYEPSRVERSLSPEELEREVQYAGGTSQT
jgi:hypothetical protein